MRWTFLAIVALMLSLPMLGNAQEQSLGEAARKAREKQKNAPKATRVYTNDTLPSGPGTVSVVGRTATAAKEPAEGEGKAGEGTAAKEPEKGEEHWRGRFAEMRNKIRQAEKELDLLQREYNLLQTQYYSDPNKALREQLERSEITAHLRKLQDKQAELRQLRQQFADLEDELRRAGGPAAWARE